jgi:hypothetical protein
LTRRRRIEFYSRYIFSIYHVRGTAVAELQWRNCKAGQLQAAAQKAFPRRPHGSMTLYPQGSRPAVEKVPTRNLGGTPQDANSHTISAAPWLSHFCTATQSGYSQPNISMLQLSPQELESPFTRYCRKHSGLIPGCHCWYNMEVEQWHNLTVRLMNWKSDASQSRYAGSKGRPSRAASALRAHRPAPPVYKLDALRCSFCILFLFLSINLPCRG